MDITSKWSIVVPKLIFELRKKKLKHRELKEGSREEGVGTIGIKMRVEHSS